MTLTQKEWYAHYVIDKYSFVCVFINIERKPGRGVSCSGLRRALLRLQVRLPISQRLSSPLDSNPPCKACSLRMQRTCILKDEHFCQLLWILTAGQSEDCVYRDFSDKMELWEGGGQTFNKIWFISHSWKTAAAVLHTSASHSCS